MKRNCPICYQDFPVNYIEEHASSCVTKFDPRSSVLDYDIIDLSSEEELEKTIPYMDDTKKEEMNSICELIEPLKLGSQSVEKLKIRRPKAWEDFKQAMKSKSWFTGTKMLHVTFLGESGVDEGGLSREFFSGYYLISF